MHKYISMSMLQHIVKSHLFFPAAFIFPAGRSVVQLMEKVSAICNVRSDSAISSANSKNEMGTVGLLVQLMGVCPFRFARH